MDDCIFCKIIAGKIPSMKVYENDKILAFLDIMPVNPGHTLVVPRAHHADLLETPDDVLSDMITRTKKIATAVMKAVNADGFNVGINTKPAAGQAVFHTHLHIMPRFRNDGLRHWPHKTLSDDEMKKVQEAIKANL
ncbi:MAG: HIT family protein [Candidatus Woesearchaeota archaeon]